MLTRLFTAVFALCLLTPLARAEPAQTAQKVIADCRQKSDPSPLRLGHCLMGEYARLMKEIDMLNDRLLGLVGTQRELGRFRIREWSSAITGGHRGWMKFVEKDCAFEGNVEIEKTRILAAIATCNVSRAAGRLALLRNRVEKTKAFAAAK